MSQERAIGVFDSGIGGLTVAGVLTRRLPHERVVYLGDTARVPYGTKSPEVVRKYAQRCADFLLTQDIKLLVIACNTATAHALPHLQAHVPVPVVGVITPGAKAAVRVSRHARIAVIGTAGTIGSGAYRHAIEALAPKAFIVEQACPLFVPLAEEGFSDHHATRLIAQTYLAPVRAAGVDTLVLGCTHYPVLRQVIADTMGPQVRLCDSAEAATFEVQALLDERRLRADQRRGPHRFFMTDIHAQFATLAERFFGAPVNAPERIDL